MSWRSRLLLFVPFCLLLPVVVLSVVHLGLFIAIPLSLGVGLLLGRLFRPLYEGRYPTRPE